jgi:hypothetical protein
LCLIAEAPSSSRAIIEPAVSTDATVPGAPAYRLIEQQIVQTDQPVRAARRRPII